MTEASATFRAEVVDIRLQHRAGLVEVWQMALDRTEFPAGGRGVLRAETRAGTRLEIPVTDVVQDAEGVLWHVVEKPLAAGTEVVGEPEEYSAA